MSSLLVVGASKVGKTVYGGQFYLRTQAGAALSSQSEAEDLTIFHKAIEALVQGKKPPRTAEESRTLSIQVRDTAGRVMDVLWPDYAGESFADLLKRRVFTEEWLIRVREASGVLLLIRPGVVAMPDDALKRPSKRSRSKAATPLASEEKIQEHLIRLLPDAQYVEWLQMMRHLRGEQRLERSSWPLTVLLTCWDELLTPGTPAEVLQRNCPLLASYLKGIWAHESLAIYGVSALGQAFDDSQTHINQAFLDKRPHEQGYIVRPDGTSDPDLTIPVAWVLEKLHHEG